MGAETILTDPSNPSANNTIAGSLALTGRVEEAHEALERFSSLRPAAPVTIAAIRAAKARSTPEHPDPRYLEVWDRRIEGMRKAGAPEE